MFVSLGNDKALITACFYVLVPYEAHAREIVMSKECGTVNTSQNGFVFSLRN